LMQVYVQKSKRATFPRRSDGVSGGEFIHSVAPSSEGRCPSIGKSSRVGSTGLASLGCARTVNRR
jgi:hypothetical protein